MKVLLLNGSPRKGNTFSALKIIEKGIEENLKADIEFIDIIKYKVNGCLACDCCLLNNEKCINHNDDGQFLIDKLDEADVVIFGTPVYWWGMSAQLKLIIDKCYCRGLQLKNKKVGTIVVGGSPVDSIQYELIDKQFDCMAKYLSWDMLFKKSYYATARDELEKNKDSMNELEGIGKNL